MTIWFSSVRNTLLRYVCRNCIHFHRVGIRHFGPKPEPFSSGKAFEILECLLKLMCCVGIQEQIAELDACRHTITSLILSSRSHNFQKHTIFSPFTSYRLKNPYIHQQTKPWPPPTTHRWLWTPLMFIRWMPTSPNKPSRPARRCRITTSSMDWTPRIRTWCINSSCINSSKIESLKQQQRRRRRKSPHQVMQDKLLT